MSEAVTEQELIKAAVAPRVTDEMVEANIVGEYYFTAYNGVESAYWGPDAQDIQHKQQLSLLTFCVLVLKNGFTVTGESACASPENFNEEIGRRIARENAKRKIWGFMGYELRSQLSQGE